MCLNAKSFFPFITESWLHLSLRDCYIVFSYSVPVFIIALFWCLSLECLCQVFRPACTTTVQCACLIF